MRSRIKIFVGELLKRLGLLRFSLFVTRKLGYLSVFTDHHANGIDLRYDISKDYDPNLVKEVFDVGASVGSMTKLFLEIFPNSSVHAFEPYSVSFNRLSESFFNKPRAILNNFALSNENGEATMYIQDDPGYNSLNTDNNKPSEKSNGYSEIIQVKTIDSYCIQNNVNAIDFLKIDAEGFDLNVLKGAEQMLNSGKIKYIFVECTFDKSNRQNTLFDDIRDFLSGFNFKLRAIYEQSNFGEKPYLTCVNALFLLQKTK